MAIKFILVSIVASFIVIMSSTVFAEGPPIIEIVIEEKITVGDGSKPSGEAINESIVVDDDVKTSGDSINESIVVDDDVKTSGDPINESIVVDDDVKTSGDPINESITVNDYVETYVSPLSETTSDEEGPAPKSARDKQEEQSNKIDERRRITPERPTPEKKGEAKQKEKSRTASERPTPERPSSPFSRGTGQVAEQPTSEAQSGLCNSTSGQAGMPMMFLLLIPAGLKFKLWKKIKRRDL